MSIPFPLPRLPLAGLLLAISLSAPADPASPATQVPGYYRQVIGRLQVTALFDGVVPLARGELSGIDPAHKAALIEHAFVPEGKDGLQTAVNAYLVDDGRHLTLVDTGTAHCFGPGLGRVPANLRASGYRPEQVDTVLITHAHPDHLCGLLDPQGHAVYPRATVWLAQADADYWLDPRNETRAGTRKEFVPLFKMARTAVAPYRASGHLRLFKRGDAMPAGLRALDTHGHTPGHTSYLFDAGDGQRLLVWGDIVHYHAVQFAHPEASFEADADRAAAIAARRRLMAQAADGRWWLGGAHLPFPGLGHVRREGDAFAWVPAEFSPLPPPAH
ncbi:MAG: MBL fold metallo-hydrolase [Pseudoxanthomonas sp.]